MYCENCGSQMPDGSKFCVSCGAKVESKEEIQEGAVQETAASVDNAAAVVLEEPVPQPIPPQPVPTPPAASQPVQSAQTAQTVQTQQKPPVYSQTAPNQNYQQPVQPISSQQQAAPQQQVIIRKPAATTPLPVWKFIGIFLLMGIPILNIVMIFVWSFGHSCNQNTKNYARAILILWVIMIVLTIVGYFTIWSSISALLGDYNMPYFTY